MAFKGLIPSVRPTDPPPGGEGSFKRTRSCSRRSCSRRSCSRRSCRTTSRTTRTTSRTTRTTNKITRTTLRVVLVILGVVLVVLEVVLVVLEVVLVVLEVTRPPVPWGIYEIRLSLRPGLYFPAPPIGTCLDSWFRCVSFASRFDRNPQQQVLDFPRLNLHHFSSK